ncbi:MAG TPA: hypothetical protein VES79_09840 [Solirubrobacteraceae bacterium]|nr:hypothetical protein [Solirubrobacteraceae bacterium]
MIVRISTENQYRLSDEHAGPLNELDNAAVEAVNADDEDGFHELFEEMLQLVRTNGSLLEADELEESDVILPPPDTTITEARNEFTGDGLIPD